MARYRNQNISDTLKTFAEFCRGFQIIRKCCTGQVTGIFGVRCDLFQLPGIAAPNTNRSAAARELQRECGTPRAGPDYGYWGSVRLFVSS